MTDELGYHRYVAHGGNLGAGTTSRLAAAHPDAVLGIHLMSVGAPPEVPDLLAADLRTFVRALLH